LKGKILVTGAAGYIGAIATELLISKGFEAVALDDLSTGHKESLFENIPFYEGKVGDKSILEKIFSEHKIDCVLHIAAAALVEESTKNPSKYFDINFSQPNIMLETMMSFGVNKIVFSSTCAVYGIPNDDQIPIKESNPKKPINPYGESKLVFEELLNWYKTNKGLDFIALRFFNVAGASMNRGEKHNPETHLIPLVLKSIKNKDYNFKIYGNDYPTKDGTTIRDYIHVLDLNHALINAIEALLDQKKHVNFYNLGYGQGYSVLEIVNAVKKVLGVEIPYTVTNRRPGDPAVLIADCRKVKEDLGWTPQYNNIEEIILSANRFAN
jgi:UDP-glucose 4-epimerase